MTEYRKRWGLENQFATARPGARRPHRADVANESIVCSQSRLRAHRSSTGAPTTNSFFIEANPNPISQTTKTLPFQQEKAGFPYPQLIDRIARQRDESGSQLKKRRGGGRGACNVLISAPIKGALTRLLPTGNRIRLLALRCDRGWTNELRIPVITSH